MDWAVSMQCMWHEDDCIFMLLESQTEHCRALLVLNPAIARLLLPLSLLWSL